MISSSTVEKKTVRDHYDLSTLFYRLLWGKHIHHGYWLADESPKKAQLQLTQTLANRIGVKSGARVLDVGCGMGGSSVYLAQQGCQVTGITLSSVQRRWATTSAWLGRVGSKTEFLVADVEKVTFPDEHFDVAWSIECTEHVFDKQKLFENLFRWLKPGGRLGICVWLAGPASDQEAGRKLVERVCDDFFCPSLGTTEDYLGWMKNAGFKDMQAEMWTDQVLQTWEICKRRVQRTGVRWIAQVIDRDQVRFIDAFDTILTAYRTRAMEYGCITATKPS